MTDERHCPRCNTPLTPSQAETGDCPHCLLELALSADAAESGQASDANAGADPSAPRPETLSEGTHVGPYTVLRRLGEGGMGVVYLAEQTEPIRRRVALKVIKHGMNTRAVVRRFELERQALARMDHPGIARVYEAGATDGGRPYFAMEYIEGEPISAYCDRNRLSTAERLELFERVCAALQHAHQKGIIHRDIKPSNILVAGGEGGPVPKIIDFGVARAVERDLGDESAMTALGVLLGTPEYMSPEQADLSPLDIDTRTDVYSLGVVLYELLTGALPFDVATLRKAAFDEIRRHIREVRPARPSTRVSELGDRAAGDIARSRRSAPGTLSRRLSGDLDLITMKALEKDRALRYGSPAELAADIRRHLDRQPVLARPPSAIYQLRKLVARHKLPSALIALLLVALLGFSAAMALLYRRASRAEAAAAREATVAKQVADFVVGVFEISDPGESRGASVTARELLDGAADRVETDLVDRPEVQARMLGTLSRVHDSLGLYGRAIELARDAVARSERLGDDRALAENLLALATGLLKQGQYAEALEHADRAAEIVRRLHGPDSLELTEALDAQLNVHWLLHEHEQALALAERILDIRRRRLGPRHVEVASALNDLGNVLLVVGRDDEALEAFREAFAIQEEAHGANHPQSVRALTNVAEALRRLARYDEAVPIFLRVQEIERELFDEDHPERAYAFNNLGLTYRRLGKLEEAAGQFEEALAIREASLPPAHPMIAWTLDNLGLVDLKLKRLDEAERCFTRALSIAEKAVGPEHPDTGIVLANLALLRTAQQRWDEAESLLRRTLAIDEKAYGHVHYETGQTLHNLGQLYEDQGRWAEAAEHYGEALAILEQVKGADHPDTVDTREHYERAAAKTGH